MPRRAAEFSCQSSSVWTIWFGCCTGAWSLEPDIDPHMYGLLKKEAEILLLEIYGDVIGTTGG